MEKIIILVANGEDISREKALSIVSDAVLIIAIDGGAEFCRKIGVTPDYILGDLDSVPAEISAVFPGSEIIRLADQNLNDMQKALNFCESLQPDKIKIINAAGLRSDHFIVNLIVFDSYQFPQRLEIHDNFGVLKILKPGHHLINTKPGETISLLSFKPVCCLTLKGFEFPLNDADLTENFIGISNRSMSNKVSIVFKKGRIFIYRLTR